MKRRLRERAEFFARVFTFFRPDTGSIALLAAVIAAGTLLGLAQVWPLAILIDGVLADQQGHQSEWIRFLPAWAAESHYAQVLILAAAALVLRVLQESLAMLRSLLHARVAHQAVLRVRCALFRKLQALSLDFHRSQPQGDAIYRLMQDSPGCEQILGVGIEMAVALLTLSVMLVVMLTRSVELSVVALAIAPILLVTNWTFGRCLKRDSTRARMADSRLTTESHRSMSSIILTQAFGRENCEYERFSEVAGTSAFAWRRVQWQMALYRLCVGALFGAGAATILATGGYLVLDSRMSVGDLMIFSTYLTMFYDPLCKISGAGANMQQGVTGMQRVFEVLQRRSRIESSPQGTPLPCHPRRLELRDVCFSYGGGRTVLDKVNLTIEPGQSVAFVGSSGVGKSTLMNLLPRFYDPTEGALLLDGIDLREIRLVDLRRHVALVLQESPILPTTIRENIAYGRPDASEEQIRAAAHLAGAHEFIDQLPQGYDTNVAESGTNLSGGQRQRIGIARALLTEAPFVVFDEPTSALDPVHEQRFVETARALHGRRTIIMVSHRLSTVQHCDQIFVMDRGQLVEQGTHEQLLQRDGLYSQMAASQLPQPASTAVAAMSAA